jgi:hypothetical protein
MSSNGATQAIIDGDVLATRLADAGYDAGALLGYDEDRRPATARLVGLNRVGGRERIIDLVESKAPGGFADIDDVIAAGELRAIVEDYTRASGRP